MPGSGTYLWEYNSGVPFATLADEDIIRIEQKLTGQPTPYDTGFIDFGTFKTLISTSGGTGKLPPETGVPFISTGLVLGNEDWNTETDQFTMSYWDLQPSEPASSASNRFYFIDDTGTTRAAVKSGSDSQELIAYLSDITASGIVPAPTIAENLLVSNSVPDAWVENNATNKINRIVLDELGNGSGIFGAFYWVAASNRLKFQDGATLRDVAWLTDITGGSGTFLGLTDTPASYPAANKVPSINAATTALEFKDLIEIGTAQFTGIATAAIQSIEVDSDKPIYTTSGSVTKAIILSENSTAVEIKNTGGGTNFLADDGTYKATGGGSSPLTTDGDIWYYNTTDARLPIGSAKKILTSNGTLPVWGGDIAIASTEKFYLDGGSDTYIEESTSNIINFVTGTASAMTIAQNLSAVANDFLVQRNLIIGPSFLATGLTGVNTIVIGNDTVPTGQPANAVQIYAKDVAASSELFAMNEAGTEFQLTSPMPQTIIKSADESVTSSITLQNDNDLTLSLTSGEDFYYEATIFNSGDSSADIKINMVSTATVSEHYAIGQGLIDTAVNGGDIRTQDVVANAIAFANNPPPGINAIRVYGYINPTSSGSLTLQWAQNVSNATATIVKKGSTIRKIKST